MAKKNKNEEVKKGLAPWMGTYSDMVTLLLCFFVLMFASSSVDAAKFEQIAASFSKKLSIIESSPNTSIMDALGNGIIEMPEVQGELDKEQERKEEGERELKKLASDFKTYFAENNLNDSIVIEQNERYLTISFKDGILFDSGKAEIKSEAIDVLSIIADELLNYPENDIKIEGHTDNVPINTEKYPSNWYLSAARAITVATFFINQKGFSPDRVSTEGYGEYQPKVPNDTYENRSINRRVEIKIISKYYSGEDF